MILRLFGSSLFLWSIGSFSIHCLGDSPFSIEEFNNVVAKDISFGVTVFFSIFNFLVFCYFISAVYMIFTGSLDKSSGVSRGLKLLFLTFCVNMIGVIAYRFIN